MFEIRTWDQAYKEWDDHLDAAGNVMIQGIPFQPSRVLKEVSPMDYRVLFTDWADAAGIDTDDLEGEDRWAKP